MSQVVSDKLDWGLSKDQKNNIAWAFGFFACVGMIISFPNTLLFFQGKIHIFTYGWINIVMALVAAAFVNGLEIITLYFAIWQIKINKAAALLGFVIVLVCAYYSCVGTFGTMETSDKIVQTETENLDFKKSELKNLQKSIDEKTNLLSANNQQIARMESQGLDVPTKIYDRSLQLSNDIDNLNFKYKEISNETINANKIAPKLALSVRGNNIFNSTFSPIFEFLMLLCTTFSILLYRENANVGDTETKENNTFQHTSMNKNDSTYQPKLTPATAKKNVGFDVNDSLENVRQTGNIIDENRTNLRSPNTENDDSFGIITEPKKRSDERKNRRFGNTSNDKLFYQISVNEPNLSLAAIGRRAAEIKRRKKPFAKSTVHEGIERYKSNNK